MGLLPSPDGWQYRLLPVGVSHALLAEDWRGCGRVSDSGWTGAAAVPVCNSTGGMASHPARVQPRLHSAEDRLSSHLWRQLSAGHS